MIETETKLPACFFERKFVSTFDLRVSNVTVPSPNMNYGQFPNNLKSSQHGFNENFL